MKVVRDILFKISDYQFPKLASVEYSPDQGKLDEALARIRLAAQAPDDVLEAPPPVVLLGAVAREDALTNE